VVGGVRSVWLISGVLGLVTNIKNELAAFISIGWVVLLILRELEEGFRALSNVPQLAALIRRRTAEYD
jgi:hypothetical protein